MIEVNRGLGEVEICCDRCGYSDVFDCETSQEARSLSKKDGWKHTRNDGKWESLCQSCIESANQEEL